MAALIAYQSLSREPVEETRIVAAKRKPPKEKQLEKAMEVSSHDRLEPARDAKPGKSLDEAYARVFRSSYRAGGADYEPEYAFLAQLRRKGLRADFELPPGSRERKVEAPSSGSKPGDPGPPDQWGPPRLVWVFVLRNVPFDWRGGVGELPADVIVIADADTGDNFATHAGHWFGRPTPPPVTPGPNHTPPPDGPSPSPRSGA